MHNDYEYPKKESSKHANLIQNKPAVQYIYICVCVCVCVCVYGISKVNNFGDHSRGRPEGYLFNSYYTDVKGDLYSFPWIGTL